MNSSKKDIGNFSITKNAIKNNYFTEAAQIIENIKGDARRDELYASLCEVYWRKEDYSRYLTYLMNITDAYKGKDKMSFDIGSKFVDNNMLISAEKMFENISNARLKERLGVNIIESYILSAYGKMKKAGFLWQFREHTDETDALIKRADNMINDITNRSEKNRLREQIESLEDRE